MTVDKAVRTKKPKRKPYDGNELSHWVYHVANPDVPGVVLRRGSKGFVYVHFLQRVGFSGNLWRGLQHDWLCTEAYLFPTPELARANKTH